MQELKVADSAHFITLTYNDENINENYELVKSDLQKYFKRLRQKSSNKIKYYAVGEYGTKTKRPHYHAIVFNSNPDNLHEAWRINGINLGFVSIDNVTQASIHYVTGYIMSKEEFDKYGLRKKIDKNEKQRPFSIMSKKLGISYVDNAKKYHIENETTKTNFNSYQGHISRYLKQKIFHENEKLRLEISEKEFKEFQQKLKKDGYDKHISSKNYFKKLHEFSQNKKKL